MLEGPQEGSGTNRGMVMAPLTPTFSASGGGAHINKLPPFLHHFCGLLARNVLDTPFSQLPLPPGRQQGGKGQGQARGGNAVGWQYYSEIHPAVLSVTW